MSTLTEDKIANLAIPILRRMAVPISGLELARLLGADPSSCYRACMNSPEIVHTKSQGLTVFAVRNP